MGFLDIPQSLRANSGIALQNMSLQIPSKFFINVLFTNQHSDLDIGRTVRDSISGRGKRCSCSAKNVQNGSGTHPASYSMGIGPSFSWGQSSQSVKLTVL